MHIMGKCIHNFTMATSCNQGDFSYTKYMGKQYLVAYSKQRSLIHLLQSFDLDTQDNFKEMGCSTSVQTHAATNELVKVVKGYVH